MNKKPYSKDNFIKTFVNQMYGILIGIGIGSILFSSNFDIKNWFSIVMILFVTSVVVTYWWDWIESIQKYILSSKSELIIDFMILIILEVLFVYYNQPVLLAITLIALSMGDMIWVLNHIRLTKSLKKDALSHACNNKWILEKVASTVIYGMLLVMVMFLFPLLNHTLKEVLTVISFIIAFFVVRKVSFRQVKISSIYEVKHASDLDVSEILRINNSYFQEGSLDLIKKYSIKDVVALIREACIMVAKDSEDHVVGYMVLKQNGALNDFKYVLFKDEALKESLKTSKHLLVDQIAIDQEMIRKGIGSIMLRKIKEDFNQPILSFVAIEPYHNVGSIKFHEANDFVHVGDYAKDTYLGRDHYLSYLYYYEKELN